MSSKPSSWGDDDVDGDDDDVDDELDLHVERIGIFFGTPTV